jgi:hypothetical protein
MHVIAISQGGSPMMHAFVRVLTAIQSVVAVFGHDFLGQSWYNQILNLNVWVHHFFLGKMTANCYDAKN